VNVAMPVMAPMLAPSLPVLGRLAAARPVICGSAMAMVCPLLVSSARSSCFTFTVTV
jgi:hypothetical protein